MESHQNVSMIARSPRDVKSLIDAQALASRRLGFSVTKACPLRCAHCSVSAEPNLGASTFNTAFTNKVVSEIPDLSKIGITCIDFTGGEPTLAVEFILRVSKTAKAHGMSVGIVSAGHWASTDELTKKFLQRFQYIDHWDISTDIYHLPFVPIDNIKRAFEALSELGRPPMIRVAHHDPITYQEAVLIDTVHKFAGKRMSFQPIGPVGRGADVVKAQLATLENFDQSACPTTGPLIQSNGVVEPCCAPLSHEDYKHPLRLGDAFREPIADIVHRWRINPLLQFIRLWGFGQIIEWLYDNGILHITNNLRTRQCDTCVAIARDGHLMTSAALFTERLENRIRIAYALKKYFDEPWMEEELIKDANEYMKNSYRVADA